LSFKNTLTLVLGPSFFNHVISAQNHLPPSVVDFNSLSRFQRHIKTVDFTNFLKCT